MPKQRSMAYFRPKRGGGTVKRTIAIAGAVLAITSMARAEVMLPEIDLSSFRTMQATSETSDAALQNVGCVDCTSTVPCRRFYITGLWGPSFANLNSPSTPALDNSATVFTAGIAAGMSFERQRGRLRVEVEGLGRDYYQSAYAASPGNSAVMVNNWSVTANAWRDFMFTERFGLYGGGGIGGGGYRLGDLSSGSLTYYEPAATFAWQAGGGLIYEFTDRLTFDVSYRFVQFDTVQQPSAVSDNQFSASEVMFGLRLFEPFRSLRR